MEAGIPCYNQCYPYSPFPAGLKGRWFFEREGRAAAKFSRTGVERGGGVCSRYLWKLLRGGHGQTLEVREPRIGPHQRGEGAVWRDHPAQQL